MAECLKNCGRETTYNRKYCDICYSGVLKWIKQKEKEKENHINGYFCYGCKIKKEIVAFFEPDDLKAQKTFLRDKNGKAICSGCYSKRKLVKEV